MDRYSADEYEREPGWTPWELLRIECGGWYRGARYRSHPDVGRKYIADFWSTRGLHAYQVPAAQAYMRGFIDGTFL